MAVRSTRGSELTPAGEFVFECASRLLEVARDIDASLGELRQESGKQITVMASPTVSEFLMPLWLLSLKVAESQEADPTPRVVRAANSGTH